MEIISYVLEGELQHRDSLGNGSVIRPGDVQRMTAGTGVLHSEQNPSGAELVHFLQIWILPATQRLPPGYEQKHFPDTDARGRLRLVASPDGRADSVTVHQDALLWKGLFDAGEKTTYEIPENRGAWVQVTRGQLRVNDLLLKAGDGATCTEERALHIEGVAGGELLLFDLA
jgi:redox-sensitive bicupin YhaK (pirin superfamily)